MSGLAVEVVAKKLLYQWIGRRSAVGKQASNHSS